MWPRSFIDMRLGYWPGAGGGGRGSAFKPHDRQANEVRRHIIIGKILNDLQY